MGDWIDQVIAESQQRFQQAWSQMAAAGPEPLVERRKNLDFAIAGIRVGLFNAAFPRGPIPGHNALQEVAGEARAVFASRGLSGMLTLPSSWLPAEAGDVLAELGFRPEIHNSGMRTARLEDPRFHPNQQPVIRLDPERAPEIMARVNGEAYGLTEPDWRSMILNGFWDAPNLASYAVLEGGEPAAVGAAMRLDDCCYILWMATRTRSRRRGYAEKIIRVAWEEARAVGAKLTVLHATAAGRPLYSQLGYARIADFPGYVWTPGAPG